MIYIAALTLMLVVPVCGQGTVAGEVKNVETLYNKAQFADAVVKGTELLGKAGVSRNDSLHVIQWLARATALNDQPDLSRDWLAALVKMDPNTNFKDENEGRKFRNVWFKFIQDTKYVPGERQSMTTVAVVDFDNGSMQDADKYKAAGIGIGSLIRYDLVESGVVYCPSRDHINYLLDELKLSQTQMADQASKLQVGKVVGAKNFIFGTFYNMPGNKFAIDARVIETETTLPKKQFRVEGKPGDVGKLVADLTKQILAYFNVQADAIKKAGANIPNVDLAAITQWSQGAAYEEKGQLDLAQKSYAAAIKISPKFALAADRQQRVEVDMKSNHE